MSEDEALSAFDYFLPPGAIAQEPAPARDQSRLLVLDRARGALDHRRFADLPELLAPGDLLVLNEARVVPARLEARRASGGRVELLLVPPPPGSAQPWRALLRSRGRLREGEVLELPGGGGLRLGAAGPGGERDVECQPAADLRALLARAGRTPLPPYIRRAAEAPGDRERYQTVYAARGEAVAAPTAGLHFTPALLAALAARGVEVARLLLQVGPGTFQPVRSERLAEHRLEPEYCEVDAACAASVNRARREQRRVVAVGTTTCRALEHAARGGEVEPQAGLADLFIRPPYAFRVVRALITNFHLPRSTLLMLVAAFAGRERILGAYAEAVRRGYRFYSYGDAMLIW